MPGNQYLTSETSVDLSDINQSGATSGQSIVFNGSNWVPGWVSGSSGSSGSTSVYLSDIDQSGAISGQTIVFNGSSWVPSSTGPTLGTIQTFSNSNNKSFTFTGISSLAKRVTLLFDKLTTTGTSPYLIQIGAGSIQTTGYYSASLAGAGVTGDETSFIGFVVAGNVGFTSGTITFMTLGNNRWVASGSFTSAQMALAAGSVTLGGAFDRIRVTTLSGVDTFSYGSANIAWE